MLFYHREIQFKKRPKPTFHRSNFDKRSTDRNSLTWFIPFCCCPKTQKLASPLHWCVDPPLKIVPNKSPVFSCLSSVCSKTTVPSCFRKWIKVCITIFFFYSQGCSQSCFTIKCRPTCFFRCVKTYNPGEKQLYSKILNATWISEMKSHKHDAAFSIRRRINHSQETTGSLLTCWYRFSQMRSSTLNCLSFIWPLTRQRGRKYSSHCLRRFRKSQTSRPADLMSGRPDGGMRGLSSKGRRVKCYCTPCGDTTWCLGVLEGRSVCTAFIQSRNSTKNGCLRKEI